MITDEMVTAGAIAGNVTDEKAREIIEAARSVESRMAQGDMFDRLQIAFRRGANWVAVNGGPDGLNKASYDYADYETSPVTAAERAALSISPAPVDGGEPTPQNQAPQTHLLPIGDNHPDALAVDRFAATMKAKLARKRAEGRGGWDDPEQCNVDYLHQLLHEQFHERAVIDPVDIANLAMMIHERTPSDD